VGVVEDLMDICDQDREAVMSLYSAWHDDRLAARHATGDEAGTQLLSTLNLHIALNGMGNLFGLVPDEAPPFDAELALEGMFRGWRAAGGGASRSPFIPG
jgi:hypothetical protein